MFDKGANQFYFSVEKQDIYSHQGKKEKYFVKRTVLSIFLSKNFIFTKFLSKDWEMRVNFYKIPQCVMQILTFSWSRSKANWRPTAFMSVLCRAEVMYMCISRKWPITPSCSDCSISNWDRSLTNHSNDFWSRLIQKKSTLKH